MFWGTLGARPVGLSGNEELVPRPEHRSAELGKMDISGGIIGTVTELQDKYVIFD